MVFTVLEITQGMHSRGKGYQEILGPILEAYHRCYSLASLSPNNPEEAKFKVWEFTFYHSVSTLFSPHSKLFRSVYY